MNPGDPEIPDDVVAAKALIRDTASWVPNTQFDVGPWDYLERVPAELRQRVVVPVLRELVNDPDPAVRKLAAEWLPRLAS